MARFRDIPQFTEDANYSVHVSWVHLEKSLADMAGPQSQIDTDPDFQRAHVWTEEQQIRFVEFKLRGGKGSDEIRWNHPNWMTGDLTVGTLELVDGKQRLQAVRRFMGDEIPAFGHRLSEYEDEPHILRCRFVFMVNSLKTRAEVIQWYLDINTGGVVHTDDEISRVRALLEAESNPPILPSEAH